MEHNNQVGRDLRSYNVIDGSLTINDIITTAKNNLLTNTKGKLVIKKNEKWVDFGYETNALSQFIYNIFMQSRKMEIIGFGMNRMKIEIFKENPLKKLNEFYNWRFFYNILIKKLISCMNV